MRRLTYNQAISLENIGDCFRANGLFCSKPPNVDDTPGATRGDIQNKGAFLMPVLDRMKCHARRIVGDCDTLPWENSQQIQSETVQRIPSGLQAKPTICSLLLSSVPTSTSQVLEPCIFQRLIRSLPPRRDTRTRRSLSGQHADTSNLKTDGRCTAANEAKFCSI